MWFQLWLFTRIKSQILFIWNTMPFYTPVFQNTYVSWSCCRYARTRRHWYVPSTWHIWLQFVRYLVTTVEPVTISSLILNTYGPILQTKGNCPHTSTIPSFSNIHRLQQINVGGLFNVARIFWGIWLPSNNLLRGLCRPGFSRASFVWSSSGDLLTSLDTLSNHQLAGSTVHSIYYYESL